MQKTLKVAKILQAVGTGETDRAQPGYSFPDIPSKHTHTNKHVVFQLGRTLRSLMHLI